MRSIKSIVALAAVAAVVGTGSKAIAADANGTASATIVTALTVSNDTNLQFGSVAATTTAGTVVMGTASDTPTTYSNVVAQAGTTTRGAITVTGLAGATYSTTLPTSVTLSGSGTAAGNNMTVDGWASTADGTIDAGGSDTVHVGATLQVGASQVAGPYSGSYTVTFNYN